MAQFKINIGNWIEYRAIESLDEPDSTRNNTIWTKSISGGTAVSFGVIATTSTLVKSGYCFQLNTPIVTPTCLHRYMQFEDSLFNEKVSNERGYTVEIQAKAITAGTRGGMVGIRDSLYYQVLYVNPDHIGVAGGNITYPIDLTDDFHTIRLAQKNGYAWLYVDGVLKTEVAATGPSSTGERYITFGDILSAAGYGGNVLWAYVKYRIDGAFPPTEGITDGWAYSKFSVTDKRRSTKHNIIRSDNNIIPENKMQPANIKVAGTVVGTCWSSFRDTVRRLKRQLNDGTQRIYIDDERFIDGLHSNFQLTPKTQSFAAFKVSFDCRYPFFQELWASYASTVPAAAATYNITNNGDIEVPCKIILTGAAAGSGTEFTLRNTTLSQEGKFVGVLQQTSELVIDKGYDDYNTYKIEVGAADSFGSYEGDLITLAPGLNALVYNTGSGSTCGTLELYWREAFLL